MIRKSMYFFCIICFMGMKAQHNIILDVLDAPPVSPFTIAKCEKAIGYLGKGLPANSSDIAAKQMIEVNVFSPGPYNFTTNTENGVTFSASGTFTTVGLHNVELAGSGIPNEFTVDDSTFSYDVSTTGTQGTCNFKRKVYVPDQNYTGSIRNDGKHRFLYKAITYNNKIWLQTNLGAHYNQVGHPQFNPEMAATNIDDYLAFGSLFQIGRNSDGHELVTWTSPTTVANLSQTSTPPPAYDAVANTGLFYTSTNVNDYHGKAMTINSRIVIGPGMPCPANFVVANEGINNDNALGDYPGSGYNWGASYWMNTPLKLVAPKAYRDAVNGSLTSYSKRLMRENKPSPYPVRSNASPQFVIEGGELFIQGNSTNHYDRRASETFNSTSPGSLDERGSLDAYPIRCVKL